MEVSLAKLILIADNDENFRNTYKELLEDAEYDIKVASSPDEARKALDECAVDLAIIDQRLEEDSDSNDHSGINLCKDKKFGHIPKIILTGYPLSFRDIRETMGLKRSDLPYVLSIVEKDEAKELLIDEVRCCFDIWQSWIHVSAKPVEEFINEDHEKTRKQADQCYKIARIVCIAGGLLILVGILFAWLSELTIGIVGTSSGIIIEALGYLFFRRLDKANNRMDIYHNELIMLHSLKLLVAACHELPYEKKVNNIELAIQTAIKGWLWPKPLDSEIRNAGKVKPVT
jgi:CheY-like chemotaxis protein